MTSGFDQQSGEAPEILAEMRAAVLGGEPWFQALLAAIARWRAPEETVDGRRYRYLVGGEAFDWLLLAERILDELTDVIPLSEKDALLYHGRPPEEITPEEFRRAIGAAKYRAYLNYLYGVTVEEALQLTYEEELEKERRAHVWAKDAFETTVYQRLYGSTREELLAAFRTERGVGMSETISLEELQEFTYWLFKYRLRCCAPPRVASDTTRGLERLAKLEALRRPAASTLMPMQDVLDLRASLV
jgi:hypothetical protein